MVPICMAKKKLMLQLLLVHFSPELKSPSFVDFYRYKKIFHGGEEKHRGGGF